MPLSPWPAYLGLPRAEIQRRADEAIRALGCCEVCPRNCRVDRLADRAKVCAIGRRARVASYFRTSATRTACAAPAAAPARSLPSATYREVACRVVREMHRQVGPLVVGDDGLARRGVLVRHLVMPGLLAETEEIFRFLAEALGPDTY